MINEVINLNLFTLNKLNNTRSQPQLEDNQTDDSKVLEIIIIIIENIDRSPKQVIP